ncbi:MAG: hypothetical protein JST75_18445 [Bacteroidetes bacterium]|nr:hypothetical protein [Bacteroidota bacterium]
MILSDRIKKAIQDNSAILLALKGKTTENNWEKFTRTHFNLAARAINKQVTKEVLTNPDMVEMNMIIGKQNLEKQMHNLRCANAYEFIRYLGNLSEYRIFNWISGKTLQSYWNGGEAKYVKINTLLLFLKVPFVNWEEWQKDEGRNTSQYHDQLSKLSFSSAGFNKSSLAIVKSYYLGNYFLYYQKTDGSENIIKTAFILKENESGQVYVKSVSEGHRYQGKVIGIRDGCLYINCQNLDFEEMEQYIFNIGLETKPQVLFGVSNTVSVKNRQAVALKNILVKQPTNEPGFDEIPETEISFSKKYTSQSEEALVVNYLKKTGNNIIITPSCCSLKDL